MQRIRVVILAVAAIVALAVMYLLRPPSEGPVLPPVANASGDEAAVVADLPLERVLVAARAVSPGTFVESRDLAWQETESSAVPAEAILERRRPQAIREFEGWIVSRSFSRGDPVFASHMLDPRDAGYVATLLAPGMRAATLEIAVDKAAGGFIGPNDRVDVVLVSAVREGRNRSGSVPRTVLENIRVIAIGDQFRRSGKKHQFEGNTATLELTPRDADILSVARELGKIHLTLRGLKDIAAPGGATAFGLSLLPDLSRVPLYTREGSGSVLKAGEYQ